MTSTRVALTITTALLLNHPSPANGRRAGDPSSPVGGGSVTAQAPATIPAGQSLEERLRAQEEMTRSLSGMVDALASQLQRSKKIFQVYGFFDVNFSAVMMGDDVIGSDLLPENPTFIFGNLNLYFDFTPTPSWRSLVEVRLLLNPLGDDAKLESAVAGTAYQRVDVTTNDYTQYGSEFDYGAIEIERAQIEWSRYEILNVTAGLYLTPFGIWNVDHGSPARLQVTVPLLYSSTVPTFPVRQLGLMFSGNVISGSFRVGYYLTLSNGRGPAATLVDWDANKAIGGRVELEWSGRWTIRAGASAYNGDFSDFKRVLELAPVADIRNETTVRYNESALGADIRLEAGPLTVLAEAIGNWRNYDDAHRPPASMMDGGGPDALTPDRITFGAYGLVGYLLPFNVVTLTPYVNAGWIDSNSTIHRRSLELGAGLNWRVTKAVVAKAEWRWWEPMDKAPDGRGSIFTYGATLHAIFVQLAMAFSAM